jgi:hypothetical protein
MFKFEVIVGTGKTASGDTISDIDLSSYRTVLESQACDLFGGFSRHVVSGGWRDNRGNVVKELSDVWVIFAEPASFGDVERFARNARSLLVQDTVCLVSPDNSVRFLSATK